MGDKDSWKSLVGGTDRDGEKGVGKHVTAIVV